MKIIFFGTADLAVATINLLCQSRHNILGVVTAPDKRKGRGLSLSFSPVKTLAEEMGLPILQPKDLEDRKFIQLLKEKIADLFVVCAYGKIFSKDILQIPKVCAINLHASLLPKYRGAAPINWAIINGENQTGVTVFKMNEYMDRGEIVLQKEIAISPQDTAVSLTEKLSVAGARVLLEAVDLLEEGRASFTVQKEAQASFAPKLKKSDGLIDWKYSAKDIHNRIRGLQPWPGAFTYFENKILKIWQSEIIMQGEDKRPGEILEVGAKNGILVQTGKDKLLITVLQLEAKKKMSAGEFIRGHHIEIGKKLGK